MLSESFDLLRGVCRLGRDVLIGSSSSTYEYTILIEKPREQVWQALWSRANMQGDIPVTYDIRQMPNDPALYRISVELDSHKKEGYMRVHERREGHAVAAERFYDADEEGQVQFDRHHIGHVLTDAKDGQATLLTQYDHVNCQSFTERLSYLIETRIFLSEFKKHIESSAAAEAERLHAPRIDEQDAFWSVMAAAAAFFGCWYLYDISWALLVFIAFAVHEFGHVAALNYLGLPINGFFMFPFVGGHALRKSKFRTQFEEAFCSLMGPMFSLLPCLVFFILYCMTSHLFFGVSAAIFALINLLNLVPLWPFDGVTVVRALLTSAKREDLLALAWTILIMGLAVALYHGLVIFAMIAGFAAYHIVAYLDDDQMDFKQSLSSHFQISEVEQEGQEIRVLPKMSPTAMAIMSVSLLTTIGLYGAVLYITLQDLAVSVFLGL